MNQQGERKGVPAWAQSEDSDDEGSTFPRLPAGRVLESNSDSGRPAFLGSSDGDRGGTNSWCTAPPPEPAKPPAPHPDVLAAQQRAKNSYGDGQRGQSEDAIRWDGSPSGAQDVAFSGDKSTDSAVKEGWCWKQSRWLKRWRRRWVVLSRSKSIATYKYQGAPKATELVLEQSFYGVQNFDHRGVRAFQVLAGRRTFLLACDNDADKDAWMAAITETLRSSPHAATL